MKSRVRMSGVVLLAVSLSLTTDGRANPLSAGDGCEYPDGFVFVMGTNYYASPEIPMPPKGTCIIDPNFHTIIGRITDKKVDGYSGPGIQNEYAKSDPEE